MVGPLKPELTYALATYDLNTVVRAVKPQVKFCMSKLPLKREANKNMVELLPMKMYPFTLALPLYDRCVTSLITKKQTTEFSSANFQKKLSPSYIILRIQRLEGNSQDLRCFCLWYF